LLRKGEVVSPLKKEEKKLKRVTPKNPPRLGQIPRRRTQEGRGTAISKGKNHDRNFKKVDRLVKNNQYPATPGKKSTRWSNLARW